MRRRTDRHVYAQQQDNGLHEEQLDGFLVSAFRPMRDAIDEPSTAE
jgi:hypothetical protein